MFVISAKLSLVGVLLLHVGGRVVARRGYDEQNCWEGCKKGQKAFLKELKGYVDEVMKENLGEIKQSLDGLKHVVEQRMAETEFGCDQTTMASPTTSRSTTRRAHEPIVTHFTRGVTHFFSQVEHHLLIGPGSGTDKKGDTKVLNISSLETINCTLPLIKHGYYGYVAIDTVDGPMLCGGKGFGLDHQSYCYVFTKEGIWVALPPVMGMKKKRSFAAAIEFDGSWWVTGGHNGENYHNTTEVWDKKTWHDGEPLPQPVSGHCIVKLNSSHLLLAGGRNEEQLAETYLYSKDKGWEQQADMMNKRSHFSCALVKSGLVMVAGGSMYNIEAKYKTEFFDVETLTWSAGPDLPTAISGSKMVSLTDNKVILIGNGKIWQLVPLELSSVSWWVWTELLDMKESRSSFDIVPISQSLCKSGNN